MDGYLSKPIDVDELIATVERFGGEGGRDIAQSVREQQGDTIFDERAALAYTGGDRRLLREVVSLFRSDYPSSFRRIDRAIRVRDPEALRLAAHSLKGAIATIGASAGRQAAAELEQAASNNFEQAGRAAETLRHEIDRLEEALAAANLIARPARRSTAGRKRRPAQRKRRSS
jgi:HPt (histidine-containing phosphotransfer) domain-containing protein